MFRKHKLKTHFGVFLCLCLVVSLFPAARVAAVTRTITFPVIGSTSYSNDYEASRASGPHHAIDIIAKKRQKLVAAVSGTITYVAYPEPDWGYMVNIRDSAGYTYRYLHINNDTPGTDDGEGGGMHAYAPDVKVGNRVVRGQLLGWVGDSGNAEETVSHLHFEMFTPGGSVTNPYNSLNAANHISRPADYPALSNEILPYGTGSGIGINVAMGNFDVDSQSETVTGAGKNGETRIKVYNHDNTYMGYNFFAFGSTSRAGVDVATGDVDGDGVDEIIAGMGQGDGSRIRVYKLGSGGSVTLISHFTAFGLHDGGARVAAADVDNDGVDEIIAGAGPGGGPRVSVFELDGTQLQSFYAYVDDFRGGVDVGAGDVVGSDHAEIITVPSKGGSPRVRVWELDGTMLSSFYTYVGTLRGGVRVSVGDIESSSPKDEISTVPEGDTLSSQKTFTSTGDRLREYLFVEEWWRGYNDTGAGVGTSKAATGYNRRPSVRQGITD